MNASSDWMNGFKVVLEEAISDWARGQKSE